MQDILDVFSPNHKIFWLLHGCLLIITIASGKFQVQRGRQDIHFHMANLRYPATKKKS